MSRRRKNDVFSEAIVGLFMIAVLALLVYFTIIISGVDVLKGRQKVVASIAFNGVGGLKEHDNVMYRGTKVGGVEDIFVTPSNLIVKIEIDKSVVLRESYRISVCSLSMLGGQFLMLEEGEGEVPLEAYVERPRLDGKVRPRIRRDEARDVGHRSCKKRGKVVDVRG